MGGFIHKRILGIRPPPAIFPVEAASDSDDAAEETVLDEQKQKRVEASERRKRRGFESLIHTTLGGLLQAQSVPLVRKRLLGE